MANTYDYTHKRDLLPGYFFQLIFRPIFYIIFRLLLRLEVKGLAHFHKLPPNTGLIVAANHTHALDGFILPASIPLWKEARPFHPVTREKGFYTQKGLLGTIYNHGLLFYIMGAFPAYGGKQNYKESLLNQVRLLNDGKVVLIFPEGKVVREDDRTGYKSGIGFLSLYTRTPILPVNIRGIRKEERDVGENMRVVCGDLIYPEKVEGKGDAITKAEEYTNEIMNRVYELES